jgi:hypothetical protein
MASVKDNQPGFRDSGDAKAAVGEARRLLQAGDADAAAAALRSYATRADAPPAELADAAKVMFDAGSPVDAVARYLEAGRGFLDANDVQRARQSFATAYEIDGKSMDALFELGRADVAEGKKHDALDKFVEVLRKSNLRHLPALYEAGCLYELDGQHNQAILAFKRVVERDKTHVSAFEHLGSLHQIRKQLPDAVANYVKAAEAAQLRFQYADAKRLAEAALAVDGGNANARRVLGEAEKAVAAGAKAQAPPPAAPSPPTPPTPQAAPTERPATSAATTVSDVKPLERPNADAHVPPPPPSTLTMGLPSEVAMLEQQSQAMAQLAQVQNAVAQTYRQRMALDEEIKRAQAQLEALQRQQQSVDEDLSGKREELDKVVAEREIEEAALAQLGDAITKSRADLQSLAGLPALIKEIEAKCSATGQLADQTAGHIDGAASRSNEARAKADAVDAAVKELQAKIAATKKSAEEHERQLAHIGAGAQDANGIAAMAAAEVEKTKAALQALSAQHKAVGAASAELAELSKTVQGKLREAEAAIARLEALQAQRKSQFEEIVFKLTPLVGDVSTPQPKPAPAPSASSSGPAVSDAPVDVDSLVASGKSAEAAKRALNAANGQPKPAEYLVDVGGKLRAAGKLDEAATLFAAARDRDQGSARARYELGATYVDLNRPDEALTILRTVENEPEYAVLAQVAIGRCLRRQGDVEAAEARFSKALEIEGRPDGDYHHALYQLADLHESKGDPESLGLALWSYEELQNGNPDYGDVAQRVAKLKAQLADAGVRSEPTRNGAVKQ